MNLPTIARTLLAAMIVVAAPAALGAQEAGAPAAELEALINEYQEVHHQLEDIQLLALRDPELNSIQEQLGTKIRAAMESHDPTLKDRITRAEAIEGELLAAQQANDVPRLQALMTEVQQIEDHFITVQQAVIVQPAIATEISAFQTRLERKMGEINPQATVLIARFKELESKIEAALAAGA